VQTANDCGFFEWMDPVTPEFLKELLLDLKNVVFKLKRESSQAAIDESRESDVQEVRKLNHLLQMQLLSKDAQLQAKEKELETLQAKMKTGLKNYSYVYVCVFVLCMCLCWACLKTGSL
jgi:hypothetical protein